MPASVSYGPSGYLHQCPGSTVLMIPTGNGASAGRRGWIERRVSASRWQRAVGTAHSALLLEACSSLSWSQLHTNLSLRRFRAAATNEIECGAPAARNPDYQILREDMPLTDFESVTFSKISNQKHATKKEISALNSWTSDISSCLAPLPKQTDAAIPSIGPIIEEPWNDDDVWAEAVTSLKSDLTKLISNIIARADKVSDD